MSGCCHSLSLGYSGANQALEEKRPHWKFIGFQTNKVTSESFLFDYYFVRGRVDWMAFWHLHKWKLSPEMPWLNLFQRAAREWALSHTHTELRHSEAWEVARVSRAHTGRITLCQVNGWRMMEEERHTILTGQQGGIRYRPIVVFPSHLKFSILIQVFPFCFSESIQVWASLLL